MSIEAGRTLSHYRLVEKLGEGGMGQVWLARDVRLEREVAVKILPPEVAASEPFRARFEREGKTISALNHPHICTLYDVGREGETQFLVMERIQGQSLAERLERGPLPPGETLEIGAQIASALAAAHRLGIVHRDLKPGNVMLTRSGAKLLDFGLAKPAGESAAFLVTATHAPTQGQPLTQEGTILGTFQYMAPEQLEGQEADARTDIFALGAVLYEMATGRRAFDGKTRTSLIAAIVSSEPPPVSQVQPTSPAGFDRLVRKCLAKDPDQRWQSAHDVADELRFLAESNVRTGLALHPAPAPARRMPWAWLVAGVLGILCLGLAAMLMTDSAPVLPLLRAELSPPPGNALIPFDTAGLALSPDGRRLAFVATAEDGIQRIWLRDLSALAAEAVAETEGAEYPFWSPDGTHLGFFAEGKLKKLDLRGGSPRVLADAPSGRGGSWGTGDTILFAPNIRSAIWVVPAAGGPPAAVTQFDPEQETTHRWPHFLPDGRHFVFVARAPVAGSREVGRLMLGSVDARPAQLLVEDSTNAVYVEPGYLIYGRGGDLLTRPFAAADLRFGAEAVPLPGEKLSFWEPKDFSPFTASSDGTVVYLPDVTREGKLTWYDRSGRPLGNLQTAGYYTSPRISADGTKVAVIRGKDAKKQELWIYDLAQAQESRLTFEAGKYDLPAWSHDGTRVAFVCMPKSVNDLCVKTLGEGGTPRVVLESGTWKNIGSWLADDSGLLYSEQHPETGMDLWLLPLDGRGEPRPILRTPFSEYLAAASPDGRHFAYESDETGQFEVYVRELAEDGRQWQVSRGGGSDARWRADGRELFYASPQNEVVAVPVVIEPSLRLGPPAVLFELPDEADGFEDVSPDGERFLLNVPAEPGASVSFHAIFNWPAPLER